MAPQLSEREQVAQVRRVVRKRQPVSAAIVAEAASRTPLITRFMRTKERKLEAARSDATSVATTPDTSAIKHQFFTSTHEGDGEEVTDNNANNALLPHTPFTSGKVMERFAQVKGRRDIYDLPEDDRSELATTPVRQAPPTRFQKPTTAKALQSEPLTSSFRYPETPSSPQRKESLPTIGVVASRADEAVTTRAQDIPLEPHQEYLTELDLEILHLGEDNHDYSPEPARTAVQQEQYESFEQVMDDADGETDSNSREHPKKRRRSNRQILNVEAQKTALEQLTSRRRSKANGKSTRNKVRSQKKPSESQKPRKKKRRIPVNELVTVTERPGNSDMEMTSSAQAEVSQDQISQHSDESEPARSQREIHELRFNLKIKIRSRKRFGAVDISLFRMPEHQGPAKARNTKSSYSDGFERNEAAPIGLYMPVKYHTRRRESYQRVTLKLDELTLVSERPSEEHEVDPQPRPRRKRRREKANPATKIDNDSVPTRDHQVHRNLEVERSGPDHDLLGIVMADDGEDQMLLDGPEEETTGNIRVPKGHQQPPTTSLKVQITPSVTSIGATTETPEHLVSPLKRKQSAVHEDISSAKNLQRSQKSASRIPQARLEEKIDEVRISQQLAATSEIQKTPFRSRTGSLGVWNELRMVSVQKRPSKCKYDTESSEEERGSGRDSAESYSERENEDEEASEENDEELAAEEDSEQNEEDDNAEEEESQADELVDEVVVDSVDPNSLTKSLSPEGIPTGRAWAVTTINSEVDRGENEGDSFSSFDQENHNTRGEPLATELAQVASQALLVIDGSGLEKQSQAEPALQGNGGKQDNCDAVSMRDQHQCEGVQSEQGADLDSSWRPRKPDTSGPSMQVDEEIVDSPVLVPSKVHGVVRRRSSTRRSGFQSQQLTMFHTRRQSPILEDESDGDHDTQESVELVQKGRNVQRPLSDTVSETQLENLPEIPETQVSAVPQMSYMERALSQLNQPFPRPSLNRAKSMPIHAYLDQNAEASDKLMAGGITMSAAFQHTISPAKSPSRMPSLLEEGSSVKKSLSSLTRQASLNMGTLPGSARARTPSLQLRPPFLRNTL